MSAGPLPVGQVWKSLIIGHEPELPPADAAAPARRPGRACPCQTGRPHPASPPVLLPPAPAPVPPLHRPRIIPPAPVAPPRAGAAARSLGAGPAPEQPARARAPSSAAHPFTQAPDRFHERMRNMWVLIPETRDDDHGNANVSRALAFRIATVA